MPQSALNTESGETAQRTGSEQRNLETESGTVSWPEPKAYLPKSRKAFPQAKALGLEVDQQLSPALGAEVGAVGDPAAVVQAARDSIAETLEVELTTKRVERLTERIGGGVLPNGSQT